MSDTKVYAFPDSCGNNDNSAMMAAMMNGGMGNQWNNPFIYLVWMMFARRMWGNDDNERNAQGIEIQSQLEAMRSQMQDNQNSTLLMDAIKGNSTALNQLAGNLNCNFNTLNNAICDVRNGISNLSGQIGFNAERVINAVNMGDCNVIQALKDCCCQTQQNLLRFQDGVQLQMCQQTGTLNNAINTIGIGVERGFAASAYATQAQTCDINNNIKDQTQALKDAGNSQTTAIIAKLDSMERAALQSKIDTLIEANSGLKTQINLEHQNAVTAQTVANAVNPLAAQMSAIQAQVNEIKCAQPSTTTIPYSPVVGVPSCVAAQYGYGYGSNSGFWY